MVLTTSFSTRNKVETKEANCSDSLMQYEARLGGQMMDVKVLFTGEKS